MIIIINDNNTELQTSISISLFIILGMCGLLSSKALPEFQFRQGVTLCLYSLTCFASPKELFMYVSPCVTSP